MKYSIKMTAKAANDLSELFDYIALSLQEPKTAQAQLDRIEEAIFSLSELPFRCAEYDKGEWRTRGLRKLPVDNYLVFYIPSDEDKSVSIIRIMYGGRDIDEHLKH